MLDNVMTLVCMMLGVSMLSMEFNRRRRCSTPATAIIVEVRWQRDARGFASYSPVFEFCVDGQKIRGNGSVPASLLKNQFQVGDSRQVLYEVGHPECFRLRGNFTMIAMGLFFLLAGIYLYMR